MLPDGRWFLHGHLRSNRQRLVTPITQPHAMSLWHLRTLARSICTCMMASGFVHARGKHAQRGSNRAPVLHQARGLRTWRVGALALLGWAVFHGRRAGMIAQLHAVLVKQEDTISPNRTEERPIFPEHAHCPLALNTRSQKFAAPLFDYKFTAQERPSNCF